MSVTLAPPDATVSANTPGDLRVRLQRNSGPYTVADWVAFEEGKERKHQLRNGEFVEMAGASFEHNVIAGNLYGELYIALRGSSCRVHGSDQRIFIEEKKGLYPDVVVFCGEPLVHPLTDALQNPLLIAEVLNSSTVGDDRGEKFELYRTRPSFKHYLLVEQHRPSVEHFEKGEDGRWFLAAEHHSIEETLSLTLGEKTLSIPLASIYQRIAFS